MRRRQQTITQAERIVVLIRRHQQPHERDVLVLAEITQFAVDGESAFVRPCQRVMQLALLDPQPRLLRWNRAHVGKRRSVMQTFCRIEQA